jgi:hypothetical protein
MTFWSMQVTSCPAHMKRDKTLRQLYKGKGFDVVDLTATIEMTQQVSFANNWREKDPTSWCAFATFQLVSPYHSQQLRFWGDHAVCGVYRAGD